MTRRVLPALLAFCSLSIACTTTTTKGDADTPKPNTDAAPSGEPEPDWSDTDPGEPEPDPNEQSPVARAMPADQLPACPSEQGNALANYCTQAGKLAGSWVPVDTLKVPDDVVIIFNAEGPDASKQTRLLIATRGDELYIEHVTCGACRRVLGQGFMGHVSHLSEDQRRELQTRLGLDGAMPVLDSTEAWASFCADERGKGALTQIASKTEGEAASGGRGR
ncbi:MAG TPA: hypothetical protein VM869_32450 [Enhygromyxa sp.]|nr:hypothetical protein [Enhygromyxa sp.]